MQHRDIDDTDSPGGARIAGRRWTHPFTIIRRIFGNAVFSSLTRRILFFNLTALVVLVGGILYLNQFRADMAASARDFARLFGPAQHFAFPFGVPGVDFQTSHVAAVREVRPVEVWSTEPRPYQRREREEAAVLPRFAIDGTRDWRQSVAHIAVRSLVTLMPGRSALEAVR